MNVKVTTLGSYNRVLDNGWTLVKFGAVDSRPGSGRRSVHTDENVDNVESMLLSQKEPPYSQRNFA